MNAKRSGAEEQKCIGSSRANGNSCTIRKTRSVGTGLGLQAPAGAGLSQFTIQGTPNLSTTMPKPAAQNVGANGIVTVPPSASALKIFSPSFTSLLWTDSAKPL